jgi:hypothetical protein
MSNPKVVLCGWTPFSTFHAQHKQIVQILDRRGITRWGWGLEAAAAAEAAEGLMRDRSTWFSTHSVFVFLEAVAEEPRVE